VVALEQIEEWRAQLKDDPSSFAKDLAHVLLLELERLHAAELACERRFAASHAALIRAHLAIKTECSACGDVALRGAEERLRSFRPGAARAPGGVARITAITRPRYS
jgi:hypothetical protein